jgi:Protein of unknown function (DUF2865)
MGTVNASRYAIAFAAVMLFGISPAASQNGLFEALFRGLFGTPPPAVSIAPPPPPPSSAFPRTMITITPRPSGSGVGALAYCVRLCDGGYFPLPRLGGTTVSAKKSCSALCPGTRTRIYWGSAIDRAVSDRGTPYSRLATAFKFRQQVVDGCTCNGKDVFGHVPVSILEDFTLRRGDIVVTENGLQVFVGSRADRHQPTDFTPIANYASLPAHERKRLQAVLVASAPHSEPDVATFESWVMFGAEPLERRTAPDPASLNW